MILQNLQRIKLNNTSISFQTELQRKSPIFSLTIPRPQIKLDYDADLQ